MKAKQHKVTVYHKVTGEPRTMSGLAWMRLKRSQENKFEEITDKDYLEGKAKEKEVKAPVVEVKKVVAPPTAELPHWKVVVNGIKAAGTLADVEGLTVGDDRPSVIKAKNKRIEELT